MSMTSLLFMMAVSQVILQSVSTIPGGEVQPLDMASTSVDDSYEGCRDAMYDLVMSKYVEHEKNATSLCLAAWNNSHSRFFGRRLGGYQFAAISMYTENCLYAQFNRASRNGSAAYKSGDFQFYALHFFLTDAVQQLKQNQTRCVTSYRRTKVKFKTDVLNQTIRFGSFTSTSLSKGLTIFGEESCFEVYTCLGAVLGKYSKYPNEQEVLIPPYETFLVTAIQRREQKKGLWCKVVYELKSAGKKSNLQCIRSSNSSSTLNSYLTVLLFTALIVA